jgi:hypothetical protein
VTALQSPAYAQEAATPAATKFLVTLGITNGGDTLATVEYDDGDDIDMKAGGLLLLGAGIDHQFGNGWEIQSTLNYHFNRTDADNGDAEFTRMPIDVLGFYRAGNHRFGGGVTYHLNPEFEIDTDFADGDIEFDNALGWVIEYDYFFSEGISAGLRYTMIDYEASDFDVELDGNHLGLIINFAF